VEVVSVLQKEEFQGDVLQMMREESLHVPFEKIMATANDLRLKGNERYKQKDFKGAITRYIHKLHTPHHLTFDQNLANFISILTLD